MALTNRQLEVLDFIKKYIANKGYAPTVREIASGLNLKSSSSAQELLYRLVGNGLITIDKNKSRTIELLVQNEYLNNEHGLVKVPYLNTFEDGISRSFVEVPTFMLGRVIEDDVFAYKFENSIFLVNTASKNKGKISLVKKSNKYFVESDAQDDIYGNIIGELRVY